MVLGIYGAGGSGREVLVLAEQLNKDNYRWEKIVFIDDFISDKYVNEIEVHSLINLKSNYGSKNIEVVISIGEPAIRNILFDKIVQYGIELITLIHPSVFIPKDTVIGKGTIICLGSFISCNVKIGDNVYIQPHVNIAHDSILEEHSVISGFANIAGNCTIKRRTYIGLSACIKERMLIGSDTIIGMGAVVLKQIPDNVIAFGNPAKPVKNNDDKRVFK